MIIKKAFFVAVSLGLVSSININNLSKFPAELQGLFGPGAQPGFLRDEPKELEKGKEKSAEEIAEMQQKKKKELEDKIEKKKAEEERLQAIEDAQAAKKAEEL